MSSGTYTEPLNYVTNFNVPLLIHGVSTRLLFINFKQKDMTNLKVTFSIDATGFTQDITEEINIPSDVCLYCLHDKANRLRNEVMKALEYKGYEVRYFFQLMKVYVI